MFQLNLEPPRFDEEQELARAEAMARDADVAIIVVGTTEQVESEGFDRDSLALPGRQDELVRRVAEANPRTIVVVNSGAPVLLPWADRVPAVLLSWFPGQEAGNALADVLLGATEPGGRLPTTWPASEEHLPSTRPLDGVLAYDEGLSVGYRAADREALFPFGYGLGYTTWTLADLRVSASLAIGDDLTVWFKVSNTGQRKGHEVIQVYISRDASTVARPVRWLAGFAAVDAEPGSETRVKVTVPARALAHWDTERQQWTTERGTFRIHVGRSSSDTPLFADVLVGAPPGA
jgi:beta-glucosidase